MDWLRSLPVYDDIDVVVVVDGGGTRSRAAVVGSSGALLGYAEGGPTNSRSAGDEAAAENLASVISAAAGAAGAPAVGSVLVTSASVDTRAHAAVLTGGVRRAVGSGATVAVTADTLGCWAATAALEPAVAVIAGTGSAVLAGSLEGGSRRYGGWDYVLGDEGSGFALGRAAIRETLAVGEGWSEATDLASACLARAGVTEPDELFDRLYKPEVDKAFIASFARELFTRSAAGDEVAHRLIGEQAELLARTVALAFADYRELRTVGVFGGLWNEPRFLSGFTDALGTAVPSSPAVVHRGDVAMAGAFRLVLRHGGMSAGVAEDAAVDRFTEELTAAKAAQEEAG